MYSIIEEREIVLSGFKQVCIFFHYRQGFRNKAQKKEVKNNLLSYMTLQVVAIAIGIAPATYVYFIFNFSVISWYSLNVNDIFLTFHFFGAFRFSKLDSGICQQEN